MELLFKRPTFIIYAKPDKYTYEFMEKTTYFTINFIRKDLYKKFVPYGNKSGRDINKEEVLGVHIQFLDNGGITFKEAEEDYVCKMMAKALFEQENLAPEIIEFYEKASTAFKQSIIGWHFIIKPAPPPTGALSTRPYLSFV